MRTKIIGFGAGGHAKVMLDILLQDERYEIVGLLDPDPALHGKDILGIKVLGSDDYLATVRSEGVGHFFLSLGSVRSAAVRRRLYEHSVALGMNSIAVIHSTAVVSTHAQLGDGVTVLAGAIINPDATLGCNVLVNSRAVVEHDCLLGDHVHVASGAVLAGTVRVGDETHIGAGAVVREGTIIGSKALVGAGAVVVKDVMDGETVVGNPARPLQNRPNPTVDLADPAENT